VPGAPLNPRAFVTHRLDLSTRQSALDRRAVVSVQFRWTSPPVSADHLQWPTANGRYEVPVTINNHLQANRVVPANSPSLSLTYNDVRPDTIYSFIVRIGSRCGLSLHRPHR